MAAGLAPALDPGAPLAVLGHSLGGVVALTLGTGWFGLRPAAVAGLGVKVRWTAEELDRAAGMAARPARDFPDRAEAIDRALRVAGLASLVAPDSPLLDGAVTEAAGGGWRLALDAGAFAVGAPDMEGLLAAGRAPVTLAAGEGDPMSPVEHLRALVSDPVVLAGLGHNAHVEDPGAVLCLVERMAARALS